MLKCPLMTRHGVARLRDFLQMNAKSHVFSAASGLSDVKAAFGLSDANGAAKSGRGPEHDAYTAGGAGQSQGGTTDPNCMFFLGMLLQKLKTYR